MENNESRNTFWSRQRLAWFIARRYLFSRERQALEWLVTIISLAGVAIGVGTIITVVSVMDGMQTHIINEIVSFVPHLTLANSAWATQDPDPALLARLRAMPEIESVEPTLSVNVMLVPPPINGKKQGMSGGRIFAADRIKDKNRFNIFLPAGVKAIDIQPGHVMLSEDFSGLKGEITFISDRTVQTALMPVPKALRLTVQGTFKVGNNFFGDRLWLAPWAEVRQLARQPHGIGALEIRLKNPMIADQVREQIKVGLPKETYVGSWTDGWKQMFSQMRSMKLGMVLVMLMTIVVAALNVIGTLALIVIQKTREVGILRAMGAPERLVGRIFLTEGCIVGLVGSLSGVVLGLGVCAAVQLLKIPMPGDWQTMKTIPIELTPWVVGVVPVVAVAVCTVAASAPAWRASRLNPVAALRHE